MINKKKIAINFVIYFLLILGYVFLYVIDIEMLIHPDKEEVPQSKVEFIYQQF